MDDRRSRPLLIAIAAIFLFEAWVWRRCVAIGRRLVSLVPWTALKTRIAAFISILPAPAALAIFLIPVAIVEPLKILCFALIAHNHLIFGIFGFIALKFIGFGLIAVTFDLTREKLLTMPWFVWVYGKFLIFNDFAHRLVAPYKVLVLARTQALREWAQMHWQRIGFRAD